MAADNYKDLAQKYGLEATSDSVAHLTKLVSSQDADLDEIAKVISQDKGLTARLLRAANPRAKSEADYTIDNAEDALRRTGIGCVLLLAMGTPLTQALVKAFDTMCSIKLESIHPKSVEPFPDEHVLCTIGFSGKAQGKVFLRFSRNGAALAAANMLGLKPEEMKDDAELNDTVGELLNICTGNLKSNLCDAGLDCKLTPPSVSRAKDFEIETIPGGGLERMAFRGQGILIFVDVTVNPFNED